MDNEEPQVVQSPEKPKREPIRVVRNNTQETVYTKDQPPLAELPEKHVGYLRSTSVDGKLSSEEVILPPTRQSQHAHELTYRSNTSDNNGVDNKLVEQAKQKKKKPAFAMTEAQMEQMEDEECDELLNFMDNLDADKFIEDLEFKNQQETLKKKVDELQNDKGTFS